MIDSNPKYANKQYYQGQKSKWVTPCCKQLTQDLVILPVTDVLLSRLDETASGA